MPLSDMGRYESVNEKSQGSLISYVAQILRIISLKN
jgi:hypothetical protein